jgi:CRP-like cAMP-binding protein
LAPEKAQPLQPILELSVRETIMQTVAFKAGDTIIAQGEEGDTAFSIVSGSVEVSIGQGGKARILGVLNAGEVFGEMCLIEPGPRSATVKATTDVECLAIKYDEFIKAIDEHRDFAATFTKALVRRLRRMNELMETEGSDRRGIRGIVRDWRKSVSSSDIVNDAADLWKMLF